MKKTGIKRILAVIVTFVMMITMLPLGAENVLAGGEPLPPATLKASVHSVKITWSKGKGRAAKFNVKITLKAGTPEQVWPAELYGGVGKYVPKFKTMKWKLRKNFNTLGAGGQEKVVNQDGSTTYTFPNMGLGWSSPYENLVGYIRSARSNISNLTNGINSGTDEEKQNAEAALSSIQQKLWDALDELDKTNPDHDKAKKDIQDAKELFANNKSLLETTVTGFSKYSINSLGEDLNKTETTVQELKEYEYNAGSAKETASNVTTDANNAANAADALLTKLGGNEQSQQTFVDSMTVSAGATEEQKGTFSTGIGKFWTGLAAAKYNAVNLKDGLSTSLSNANVEGNGLKALNDAETAVQNYNDEAKEELEDAAKELQAVRELADSATQDKIDNLLKEDEENPGDVADLMNKLDKTEDSLNDLQGEMGVGPKETDTVTVAVSLEPSSGEYMDEIVYIGEVEKGKDSKRVDEEEPEEGKHTVTVNYVIKADYEDDKGPNGFVKTESGSFQPGEAYSFESKTYQYYTADQATISGTMGDKDLTFTVTYTNVCPHANSDDGKDDKYHWIKCNDCHVTVYKEAHSPNTYEHNNKQHWWKCSCGWVSNEKTDHEKQYGGECADPTKHHFKCAICQYEGDEKHNWKGSNPLATICDATCENCKERYVSNKHKFGAYTKLNDKQHIRTCTICGWEETKDCVFSDYKKGENGTHYKICSFCKQEGESENCGHSFKHTTGRYHKDYCEKCKRIWDYKAPCEFNDWLDLVDTHFRTCKHCENEEEGGHTYPDKTYNVNYKGEIRDGKTVWSWDIVKYCSKCGREKWVGQGPAQGGGGGNQKDKTLGGGAAPSVKPSQDNFEDLVDQALNADVVTDIDDLVMDQYFDLVGNDMCDDQKMAELVEEKFGAGTNPEDVTVVVEPTVTVRPSSYSGSTKTLSVDITATYNIVLEKGESKETVESNKTIPVNSPVYLRVNLPDNFGSEGKRVSIKHTHNGDTHTYTATVQKDEAGHYFLEFTARYGFSPFTFELIEEERENDVASVTFSYETTTGSSVVYKTAYFETVEEAFLAASELDFADQLPNGASFKSYKTPVVQLLKDVTVGSEISLGENIELDLNGHTFTVLAEGIIDNIGVKGIPEIAIRSSTPGTFTSSGTIHVAIGTWTADTINIQGGLLSSGFSVDGGTVNISGGEVNFAGRMINNGGEADIQATISGNARVRNMSFIVYKAGDPYAPAGPLHNIHLTLNGGYYDVNPETYKTGQTGGDPYDQSENVTFNADNVETYDPIYSDEGWAEISDVYKFRIRGEGVDICTHAGTETEIRDKITATCTTSGCEGNKYCKACGSLIEKGKVTEPLGHDYEISYVWSEDGKSCEGTAICKRQGCKEDEEGHKVTESAKVTSSVKVNPSSVKKGITIYTATFTKKPFTTQTKELEDIPVMEGKAYLIRVIGNATAKNNAGESVKSARKGEQITISWIEKEGYTFEKWTLTGATPANETATTTTFIMGEKDVTVDYVEKLAKTDEIYEKLPDGTDKTTKVSNLAFEKTKLTMDLSKGAVANVATATPVSGKEAPAPTYVTANKDIVAVDQSGNFYPMGIGTAVVTAYCGNKKATCTVTVVNYTTDFSILNEDGDDVSGQTVEMLGGEKKIFSVAIAPYDSTDSRNVTWSTSNKNAVTVSKGIITVKEVKNAVSATITATVKATGQTGGKLEKSVTINVTPMDVEAAKKKDNTCTLSVAKTLSMNPGKSKTLTVTLTGKKKIKKDQYEIVSVETTNSDVITVGSPSSLSVKNKKATFKVKVKAESNGTAYVIVKTKPAGAADSKINVQRCKVTVSSPATKLSVESGTLTVASNKITMRKGQRGTVEVVLTPELSTDLAKVKMKGSGGIEVKNGIIYAKKITKKGKLTVTCGKKTKTIKVVVTK